MNFAIFVGCLVVTSSTLALRVWGDLDEDEYPITGCGDYRLVHCFLPIVEFCFSSEGIQLTFGLSNGQLQPEKAIRLYSLLPPAVQCFQHFVNECIPLNYTDAHLAAAGGVELVSIWNWQKSNPTNFSLIYQGQLFFTCLHKMEQDHQQCTYILDEALPKDVETTSPQVYLRKEKALWEMCCYLKKYQQCYMPAVRNKCTTLEASANDFLFDHIYRSFNCTPHFSTCSV